MLSTAYGGVMNLLRAVAARKETFVEIKKSEWHAKRIADVLASNREATEVHIKIGEHPSGKFPPKWLNRVMASFEALPEVQSDPPHLVLDSEASFMASSSLRGGYGCKETRMWDRDVTIVMNLPEAVTSADILNFPTQHPANVGIPRAA